MIMHFSDKELIILSVIDLVIVYLFCILQISYNILTAIYINKAKNKINRLELWRAYLFALAPIIYSILPILLVLYLYQPSSSIPNNINYPGYDFAIKLIYFHLPPICIVFIIIIIWNIICSIHNTKFKTMDSIIYELANNYINQISNYDNNTKVIFRKAIFKWFNKIQQNIINSVNNKDLNELNQILAKVEGWYIAKQRFQFFWAIFKKYEWIKQYYFVHYNTLIYKIQFAYIKIKNL